MLLTGIGCFGFTGLVNTLLSISKPSGNLSPTTTVLCNTGRWYFLSFRRLQCCRPKDWHMLVKIKSNSMDAFIFHYYSTLEGLQDKCVDLHTSWKLCTRRNGPDCSRKHCLGLNVTYKAIEIYDSDFVSSHDDVAKSLELHCSILRCQLQEMSTTERRGADAPNTVDFNVNGVALKALRYPAIQYIISMRCTSLCMYSTQGSSTQRGRGRSDRDRMSRELSRKICFAFNFYSD